MPKLPHAFPAVPTLNRFAALADADAQVEIHVMRGIGYLLKETA